MFTEEQTKEILEAALEEVKISVVEKAKVSVEWYTEREMAKQISLIIEEFVLKEVKPSILINLEENKSIIIDAAIIGATEMAKSLAEAMAGTMASNLADTYQRRKILEELFK